MTAAPAFESAVVAGSAAIEAIDRSTRLAALLVRMLG
jgi:hypothetical protein